MSTDQAYTISELATLAGVTPRTIRYYLSIGLLPSPGQGPGTRYGDGHLARLRLIRRLQREHLPLGEITRRLEGLDDTALDAAVDAAIVADETGLSEALSGPAAGSALEYIQRLKEAQRRTPSTPMAAPLSTAPRSHVMPLAHSDAASSAVTFAVSPFEPEESAGVQRTQWERVTLSPNVELHVRRPSSRVEQKRVERLIRLGRELLEGGRST
jgi:DNA-binding transcriptional MerR regulator